MSRSEAGLERLRGRTADSRGLYSGQEKHGCPLELLFFFFELAQSLAPCSPSFLWVQHVRWGGWEWDERSCPTVLFSLLRGEAIATQEWKSRVGSFEHVCSRCQQ